MLGQNLKRHYESLRRLGLVRSQRSFSEVWLGRNTYYLRNIEPRNRGWRRLSPITTTRLRTNLIAVAARVPRQVADEIDRIVEAIDRDVTVTETMNRWRG